MRNTEVTKNRCYHLQCGAGSNIDMDDCNLDRATNDTGHGSCKTTTTYGSDNEIVAIDRTSNPENENVPSTFGRRCSSQSAGGTLCSQNCVGDLCNQYTLSNSAVCLTCQSIFPSIDFNACLHATSNDKDLVQICPKAWQYCVTRQVWNEFNQTIAVQKGCTVNETSDFYTGHVIPFHRECWHIPVNPENNATYICSQKYTARSDEATNDVILNFGNWQINPTTPAAGFRLSSGVLLCFYVFFVACFTVFM